MRTPAIIGLIFLAGFCYGSIVDAIQHGLDRRTWIAGVCIAGGVALMWLA